MPEIDPARQSSSAALQNSATTTGGAPQTPEPATESAAAQPPASHPPASPPVPIPAAKPDRESWLARHPRSRRVLHGLIIYLACSAVYFSSAARDRIVTHTPFNHYALLADSWLHKQLELRGPPPPYAAGNDTPVAKYFCHICEIRRRSSKYPSRGKKVPENFTQPNHQCTFTHELFPCHPCFVMMRCI